MANRTRARQPLLPILVQHVNDEWHRLRELLDAARQVGLGEDFVVAGVTWTRASTKDQRHNRPPVRAINRATGELVKLSRAENLAFWQWAVIETLRSAGVRVEELSELSHLSVRQYQRANGEVVALLVITPSKSDRERVMPMSAELFHVIAQIIRRHREQHGLVPTCARYDPYEKTWSEELPTCSKLSTVAPLVPCRPNDLAQYLPSVRGAGADASGIRRGQIRTTRFQKTVRDRTGQQRSTDTHRRRAARTPRHPNHPRFCRGLQRGRHHPIPVVPGPTPSPAATGGIPGTDHRGMERLQRALRQAPRRTRLLRTSIWHSLPARARVLL